MSATKNSKNTALPSASPTSPALPQKIFTVKIAPAAKKGGKRVKGKPSARNMNVKVINGFALVEGMTNAEYFKFLQEKYQPSEIVMMDKNWLRTTGNYYIYILRSGAPIHLQL